MYELKILSKEAIPAAMKKAERYRVSGESLEAESICGDIMEVDPDNQDALLRWNTCARTLMRNSDLVPSQENTGEQMLE